MFRLFRFIWTRLKFISSRKWGLGFEDIVALFCGGEDVGRFVVFSVCELGAACLIGLELLIATVDVVDN